MADPSLIPANRPPRKRGPGRPFQKGQSGNLAGRPPVPSGFKDRAVAYAQDALDVLHAIATDTSKPAAARVTAASVLIDRAHGKAIAPVATTTVGFAELIAASMRASPLTETDTGPGIIIEHEEQQK